MEMLAMELARAAMETHETEDRKVYHKTESRQSKESIKRQEEYEYRKGQESAGELEN